MTTDLANVSNSTLKDHHKNKMSQERAKDSSLIVVIDDDLAMLEFIEDFLGSKNINTKTFSKPFEALSYFEKLAQSGQLNQIESIISDIQMPALSGNELLAELTKLNIEIPLIFATAFGTISSAIASIKQGAFDYIVKPFKLADLEVTLQRAKKLRALQIENAQLRDTFNNKQDFAGLIGQSDCMKALFQQIERLAPTHANILIVGEIGSGKEKIARAVHAMSHSASGPFIAVNCRAIPEHLLESQLFGQVNPPFTPGAKNTGIIKGFLSQASQGTLFIDDVGDLSPTLQSKILRVIQERRFFALGGTEEILFDARLVTASQKNLARGVSEGWFREDFFYRLNVVPLKIPPLRNRRDDIPLLAAYFLRSACVSNHFEPKRLDSGAMRLLCRQAWHGNVRQLQNLMERLAILSPEEKITAEEIERLTTPGDSHSTQGWFSKLLTLAELEKEYIQYMLTQTQGRKEETARLLGINRRTLYRKEREYGFVEESADSKS